jgi:lipopolysaccharide biosynthesis regulator YciM
MTRLKTAWLMMTSGFKSMYLSRLEVTATGKKLLVVYYDDKKLDWDKAIEWARKHHKLSKPVQTIAFPQRFR